MLCFDIDMDEVEALLEETEVDVDQPVGCDDVMQGYKRLSETWYQ